MVRLKSGHALAIVAFLTAMVVQPGEMESIDTLRRLQQTHALWTSVPAVAPGDYPDFGLVGRDGKLYPWYGIGQSLVMLPADLVISAVIKRIPRLASRTDVTVGLRTVFVSIVTSVPICVASVLVAFGFLKRLAFSEREATAGAMALLFCTLFLHYTQNVMENNLMLLLTLIGFSCQYEWFRSGSVKHLFWGAMAFGANLLVRLPTAIDLTICGVVLLSIALVERAPDIRGKVKTYLATVVPVLLFWGALDRLVHYLRFGTLRGTYIGIQGVQQRLLHPEYPPDYPFNTPFPVGFWGALISPEKSLFLFEPLTILLLLLCIAGWRSFSAAIKVLIVSLVVMVFGYISFYAKFVAWAGDDAWGDRYITTPLQIIGLIAVALLVRLWPGLKAPARWASAGIVAVAFMVQVLSLTLWMTVEVNQYQKSKQPTLVIAQRVKNLEAIATGNVEKWGLRIPRGYPHTETPYFMPFLLRADHLISPKAGLLLTSLWWMGLLLDLAFIAWMFRRFIAYG